MNLGIKTIIGVGIALVIAIVLLLCFYGPGVKENVGSFLYWVGNVVIVYLFYRVIKAVLKEGDGVDNSPRLELCLLAVVVIVWFFAWAAAPRERAQVIEDSRANAAKTVNQ